MRYQAGENYYEYLKEQKLHRVNPEKFTSAARLADSQSEAEYLEQDFEDWDDTVE
jgi:hypothetical protein